MNLFFIESTPEDCARSYVDKHVTKIMLEATQMLCTAARRHGFAQEHLYKETYPRHPMTIWVGDSSEHFMWTLTHAQALYAEYLRRYQNRTTYRRLRLALATVKAMSVTIVRSIPDHSWHRPPQCMPDQYKAADYRTAYRLYYAIGKEHLHAWRAPAKKPGWIDDMQRRYGPSESAMAGSHAASRSASL